MVAQLVSKDVLLSTYLLVNITPNRANECRWMSNAKDHMCSSTIAARSQSGGLAGLPIGEPRHCE